MGVQEHRMTAPAILENIEEFCEFVSDIARASGMNNDGVYHCYLSVEEICTNVIEHGYAYRGDNSLLDIRVRTYPDRLHITIFDDAQPFNPLLLSAPDPNAPLTERRSGGWGVFFVKKFMDRLDYRYQDGYNQFVMEKHLS